MKQIVSISLGSSKRDHEVEVMLLGEQFKIWRQGTDGDFKRAQALLAELDGKVDAIGLGGIDIYLYASGKRYALRDGLRLKEVVKKTPVVDGSGLKNTLEREVIRFLNKGLLPFKGRKVLMVSALDRFGMAEALAEAEAEILFGDLIFALGLDKPIRSMDELTHYAEKLLPEVSKLPIGFLYPIGRTQEKPASNGPYTRYYEEADIIAGDFHFVRKYLPEHIPGKIIITNSVTEEDLEHLRQLGVSILITTTPEFNGRSFGTNVLEAVLISMLGKSWEEVTAKDYLDLLNKLGFSPRVERLNQCNTESQTVS